MLARLIESESGYSLVEVMASIMILAIAIIPMVGMFDIGLETATRGGQYDTARAFANKKLEQARSLPYEDPAETNVVDVENDFPVTGSTPSGGSHTSPSPLSDANFPGFTYTVTKQYKCVSSSTSSCTTPTGGTAYLADSSTDQGFIELTVTVSWDGKSYTRTGVVSRGKV